MSIKYTGTITNVTAGDDGVTIHSDKSKFGTGKASGSIEFSGKTECAAINQMKAHLADNKVFKVETPTPVRAAAPATETRQSMAAKRTATVKAKGAKATRARK
jgi:hypothetical protein